MGLHMIHNSTDYNLDKYFTSTKTTTPAFVLIDKNGNKKYAGMYEKPAVSDVPLGFMVGNKNYVMGEPIGTQVILNGGAPNMDLPDWLGNDRDAPSFYMKGWEFAGGTFKDYEGNYLEFNGGGRFKVTINADVRTYGSILVDRGEREAWVDVVEYGRYPEYGTGEMENFFGFEWGRKDAPTNISQLQTKQQLINKIREHKGYSTNPSDSNYRSDEDIWEIDFGQNTQYNDVDGNNRVRSLYEIGYGYAAFTGLSMDCATGKRKWIMVANCVPSSQNYTYSEICQITAKEAGPAGHKCYVKLWTTSRNGHDNSENLGMRVYNPIITFEWVGPPE